jgi:hypothetical protein
MGWESFKNLLKNHSTWKAHIYMKVFWHNVNLSFFKAWSPGVGRNHSRENHIYIHYVYIKKICFWRTSFPISIKLGTYHPWVKGILNHSHIGPGPLQKGIITKMQKNEVGSFIFIYFLFCFVLFLFCFESHEQFFSYLATVTITGDGAANLDRCLALTDFSSKGSFPCHTYCDTGPPF